ncbi:16S rRNA (guanine1207-N2)-methyltransferase [Microbulbifer thermotolerans]|uniref:class I SAM-dependent methyltransferase n=1 Tax=Microbulbifer thermotolerans TaxID=252514 RepID=UPI0008E898FB|nr:methyltransferase [Microbulbifer thermotolerans]WKT59141.1 methyltransferase [Microbulbifer thermotolerans]SFB90128.1 16S rRNA (guanine1207-N2)-methyltransferase [Microbulbifer thermotolerans]
MATLLSQELQVAPRDTLWIADENSKSLLMQGFTFAGDLLSNRWDVAKLAEGKVGRSFFNDFAFEVLERSYRRIVYPVSKEKAVVHHVINRAPHLLEEVESGNPGELVLLGGKQSGIKSYATKAAQRFGCAKQLQKHGTEYISCNPLHRSGGEAVDDQNYTQLRPLEELHGLHSKPGLFGWNKIDRGSALLARHFAELTPSDGACVVDLGCGYGYLCAQLAQQGHFHFTATDNNAAALLACSKNFRELGIEGVVVPSNAGAELTSGTADLIICNPPFHQGFQVEGELTDRFLSQTARLLKPGAPALFVVNAFIPLPRKAGEYFSEVHLLAKENGFCVYKLSI